MKYKHYAPDAPMTVFRGEREAVKAALAKAKAEAEASGKKVGILDFDEDDLERAEKTLFARLRDFDKEKVDVIYASAVKSEGAGFAVMNRMRKAAASNVIDV